MNDPRAPQKSHPKDSESTSTRGGKDQESREGYSTVRQDRLDGADNAATGAGRHATLFQPGLMIDGILQTSPQITPADETRVIDGEIKRPELPKGQAPYLLVVGASAGEERISILHARTTFGRDQGDVRFADTSISSLHFQLDAIGNEFFIRDLDSRNGTLLNGFPVRYSEVFAGDEIQAGETALIFRVEGDGLAKRDADAESEAPTLISSTATES